MFKSSPVIPNRSPTLTFERRLWAEGFKVIAGIDEAGRGAWAGPVVAAAVVFAPNVTYHLDPLSLVRDSKLLSPRQRDRCYDAILEIAAFWGVGAVSSEGIDACGILVATREAMRLAVERLAVPADYLLIDAVQLSALAVPQRAIIKGDRLSLSIAAASIVAKVTRDRWMRDLDGIWPGYGFAAHKGYGTAMHQASLARLGATPIHRHSYAPISAIDGRMCDG